MGDNRLTEEEIRAAVLAEWVEPDKSIPEDIQDLETAEQLLHRLFGDRVRFIAENEMYAVDYGKRVFSVVEVDGYLFGWLEDNLDKFGCEFIEWVWEVVTETIVRYAPK